MITREEIDQCAQAMDVHVANVQRDYVFGWMLKTISEDPYLGPILVLKGGTCLRKVYVRDARFSADLDFSTNHALDATKFEESLRRCCNTIQGVTGVRFDESRSTVDKPGAARVPDARTIYRARVHFQDFYEVEEVLTIAIHMDVAEFDLISLPTRRLPLIHPYSDSSACQAQIHCIALEEVVAGKMKCLLQRRHVMDLFDMALTYLVRNEVGLDRQQALNAFLKKTIFSSSPSSARGILLGLPFERFRDAWRTHIVCPAASRFDFDAAAAHFRGFLEELFKPAGTSALHDSAFFPADLRFPILEAGVNRKLLELTYSGVTRKVEPYALAFKRNDRGVAQEYFYCWDRTGGRTSPPGIRTLLNTGITSLRVTEEDFEPQFPIELSKAGEHRPRDQRNFRNRAPSHGFQRASSGAKPRKAPKSPFGSPFKQTYTIQCPYCLRKFKRETNDVALRKHKSPNGFECHARKGMLIWG